MLSRLPEIDDDSRKHKEVDLKKEIWLQTLPSCVRVLQHNTDEMSMDDLSTLADEIMMSQNAARHDTSRRTLDAMPVRRTPDAMPVQGPTETNTDDVAPVQRANWYSNHNRFHATLESNGLYSYHKFGNHAQKCISGVDGFQKTSQAVVSRENGRPFATTTSL